MENILVILPEIIAILTLSALLILERKRNIAREKELTDLLVAGTLREYTYCNNAMTPKDSLAQTKLEGKVEKEKLEAMVGGSKGGSGVGSGIRVPVT